MATINCPTTLECPALPRVTLSQAVIDLLALGAEDVAQSTFLQRDTFHQINHSLTQGNTGQGRTFQRSGTIDRCHRGLILSI